MISTDFSANSAGPIGTAFTVTTPERVIFDEVIPASTSTRYASACLVSFPTADPVAEMTAEEFMAAMFS